MATFTERIMLLIDAQTGGAVQPLDRLEKQAKQTDTAMDKLGKSVGITGASLKTALVAGATALVGTGLVTFLNDSVNAYADAAKAAGDLANATGGSVDEVSRLTAALEDSGVSAEQTSQLLSKFTTSMSTEKGVKALQELNVQMVKNADGSTNYVATMVKVVDAIGEIGDSAERNRKLVDIFGKQGSRIFIDLYNSGMKLSDAMQLIDKYRVFTADDVRRAAAYDDAMDSLKASVQGLQFEFGRTLIPLISTAAGIFADLVGVLSSVPTEVYLVAGAFVALNAALKVTAVQNILGLFTALATGAVSMSTVVVGAFDAMTAAILANPIGLVLAGVAAAIAGLAYADKRYREGLDETAREILKLTEAGKSYEQALAQIKGTTEDKVKAEMASNDVTMEVYGTGQMVTKTLDAQEVAYNKLIDDVGAYGAEQMVAADATTALNDAVSTLLGTSEPTGQMLQDVADSASDVSQANLDVKRTTNLAEIAMGQYAESIQGVVEWQQRLVGISVDIEEGLNDVQDAYKTLKKTTDDPATWGDEWEIQAGKAKTALLDVVDAWAASGMTDDEIVTKLIEIKEAPGSGKQLDADIDATIAQITGKGNEIPVDLTVEPRSKEAIQAELDGAIRDHNYGLQSTLEAELAAIDTGKVPPMPVTLTGPSGEPLGEDVNVKVNMDTTAVDTAKADVTAIADTPVTISLNVAGTEDATNVISGFTHPKEVLLNVNVQGRGDAENVLRGLTHSKEIPLNVNIHGRQDAENVIAGLTHDKEIPLHVNIHGRQDAENVLNGLDNDRYVTIHISTQGAEAARNTINGLGRTSSMGSYLTPTPYGSSAPVVYNQSFSIDVSGAGSPAITAREIDRYIRRAGDQRKVSVTA